MRAPSGPRAMTPCEFGPTSRTLCARQSASRSRPAAVWPPPVSPDDTTTAAPTPAAQASAITSGTWSAGTTTTTRSTGSGTAETEAYAGTPSTASASGCTTLSRPAYPPDLIASRTARPSPPPWRRTPTTATLAGASRGRSERASERHSRRSAASSAAADTSVRSSTDTSPSRGPPRDREPGPAEHAEHAVVVTEHLGLEAGQPVRATQGGEVLEQQDAETAAVVLVGDQERDLGALVGPPPRRWPARRPGRGPPRPSRPSRRWSRRRGARRSAGRRRGWR